jgi:Rod binding domain-containing protein
MRSIPGSLITPQAPAAQSKPKNAAEAAKQFEALLIAQMLRTAHESNAGSLDGGDSSSDAMYDVAGQQFAQVLANNGGLGLAKMIAQGLQRK